MNALSSRKARLAYFVSHPIQYQVPLLRRLSETNWLELKVIFASDFSVHGYKDAGFKREIRWDIPLTEGLDFQYQSHAPASAMHRVWGGDIERLLRDGNFDAVWVHGWAYPWSLRVIRIARRLGLPVLFRCEFNSRNYPPPGWTGALKMTYLQWLFGQIDAFLCIGSLNRDFYLKSAILPHRLFSVPYTVENVRFASGREAGILLRRTLLRQSGLAEGTPLLLYASKFSEVKRPKDLVEAWRRLMENGQKIFILWVGDGPLRCEVESICRRVAPNFVHFAGFLNQSELPAFYAASDVFVLPSAVEPWGLVVNEAMAAGLPIVVTDVAGCAPDLVHDGRNGCVVPVGNIEALRNGIKWCLENRKAAGEASRTMIDRWSYRECEIGIHAALKSVLSAKNIGAM